MPRPQHQEFTQYLLPEEAWLAPQRVWDTLRNPATAAPWLRQLWDTAYQYANVPDAPIEPTELAAEVCEVGGQETILLTLPAPVQPGEAFLALLVLANPFQYFLLEAAPPDGTSFRAGGPTPTALYTRQPDIDHRAYLAPGPLADPVPAVPLFLQHVVPHLTASSLR